MANRLDELDAAILGLERAIKVIVIVAVVVFLLAIVGCNNHVEARAERNNKRWQAMRQAYLDDYHNAMRNQHPSSRAGLRPR